MTLSELAERVACILISDNDYLAAVKKRCGRLDGNEVGETAFQLASEIRAGIANASNRSMKGSPNEHRPAT